MISSTTMLGLYVSSFFLLIAQHCRWNIKEMRRTYKSLTFGPNSPWLSRSTSPQHRNKNKKLVDLDCQVTVGEPKVKGLTCLDRKVL